MTEPKTRDESQCRSFIKATAGRSIAPMLKRALTLCPPAGRALELGCGAGDDALTMLQRGYAVSAVDEKQAAIDAVTDLAEQHNLQNHLKTHLCTFAQFKFDPAGYSIINARFSIPFCPPDDFEDLWKGIRKSLLPGGVYTGQFFGPHDTFATEDRDPPITSHTQREVRQLIDGLIVHQLEEEEKPGHTAIGRAKHWHVISVLVQQPEEAE